jgi:cell pole-organizing protein PopZ
LQPKAEPEPVQEPVAEPRAAPDMVAPNANVAQEPVQNKPEPAGEAKKELAEDVSQNIMDKHVKTDMAENKPNILSEDIANKSSKAIQNLLNNIPRPDIDSPAFRSAITLEDVVMEMIKPMLKEWLDNNLEAIVRDIVEKEIKKIIQRD